MILVDANLLIYAQTKGANEHDAARQWLEERLNGTTQVGLPWGSLLAFLRVMTHPRIQDPPVSFKVAWRAVADWLKLPPVWIPLPTDQHAEILGVLLERETRADVVPDAHLAALAIEHGLTLCSNDRDFARFEGLRWENPLETVGH